MSEYQNILRDLLSNSKTLALATVNSRQEPEASTTPYIFYECSFWIFVSQLSAHTENLLTHQKASVLLTEEKPDNIFASTRCTIQCKAKVAEAAQRDSILDIMTQQLGETVSMLRQLPDFHLLELQPQHGRFIAGFGKAFDITFPNLVLNHINANT